MLLKWFNVSIIAYEMIPSKPKKKKYLGFILMKYNYFLKINSKNEKSKNNNWKGRRIVSVVPISTHTGAGKSAVRLPILWINFSVMIFLIYFGFVYSMTQIIIVC